MAVDNALRLRQICLLAYDLEWISGVLSAAFDAPVVFRDPRMAAGGNLTNTHTVSYTHLTLPTKRIV